MSHDPDYAAAFPRTFEVFATLGKIGHGLMQLDDLRLMKRLLSDDGPPLTPDDLPRINELRVRIDAVLFAAETARKEKAE